MYKFIIQKVQQDCLGVIDYEITLFFNQISRMSTHNLHVARNLSPLWVSGDG